jgi:phospholipid/cholesterol/gamma-HCH transport system permease protein
MIHQINNFVNTLGDITFLLFKTLKSSLKIRKRKVLILNNILTMGVQTLPIIMIMSFFVGMVLALQSGYQLMMFGLTDLLGSIVFLSLLKELAPVQAAVLMLAKVGTSITAELGTMKVSEEIEAINIMGIDVTNYLIVPRFWACILSTIMLVIYTNLIGLFGGALVAVNYVGISLSEFMNSAFLYVRVIDVTGNIIKAVVFGVIVAIISCYYGINVKGGSEGVGKATTSTVVVSFLSLLIANYFITKFLLYFE